jgi:hypothetical protein
LVQDSAGVTIVENSSPLWEQGEGWKVGEDPTLDIGVLEGDSVYQFFHINGVRRMSDGRLAVANGGSGEIRFFDASGAFLNAVGGKGSGPGEYEDLFFLRRTVGDSLLAYDWRTRRVSVHGPDGEYARSFTFTILTTAGGFPVAAEPFPDGDILLVADMFSASEGAVEGAKRDSAMYYVIDRSGETTTTLGAFPGGESYETTDGQNWVGGGLVFGRFGYTAVSGSGFYYGSSDEFEVEYRDKRGDLLRLIRLDHENLTVTQSDIDRYTSERLERVRPERRRIHELMYENMPFPSTMPAYSEFRVDTEGNLWVGVYRRPGDDQPRWNVFDPEGAYLGVVETPMGLFVHEMGPDYVLGEWRDDLGVEHIRMYPLFKG